MIVPDQKFPTTGVVLSTSAGWPTFGQPVLLKYWLIPCRVLRQYWGKTVLAQTVAQQYCLRYTNCMLQSSQVYNFFKTFSSRPKLLSFNGSLATLV